MADGFYFNIYGSPYIGHAPAPKVYSVLDQVYDNYLGDKAVKQLNKIEENALKRMGAWYPEDFDKRILPIENGGGALIGIVA